MKNKPFFNSIKNVVGQENLFPRHRRSLKASDEPEQCNHINARGKPYADHHRVCPRCGQILWKRIDEPDDKGDGAGGTGGKKIAKKGGK